MALQFFLKRGDTAPSIRFAPLDGAGAAMISVGATARFLAKNRTTGAVVINAAATVVTGNPLVLQYDWQALDTSSAATLDAEFEVTHAGGQKETIPNYGIIEVIISNDIA